ncbi:MFS transporter [Erythrobacter westpacificensis]|uniref:MFS transporter n=1 Tax=Erythrobacter westpacificensis TaxID=1055231 RepID=A0ABP9KQ52_9SPHN
MNTEIRNEADPRAIIADGAMSKAQIAAIALCTLLNALDGYDVLSISLASPAIARDWDVDPVTLGVILSMELVGMALGSILIGRLADRFGRRPLILACATIVASGMFLASTANDITALGAFRLFTGLGIGGMTASIVAMTAELANARSRNLAVTLMASGFPMGAAVGGAIASSLLAQYDWRIIFIIGGMGTAAAIPLIFLILPESIEFLLHRRPRDTLRKVNATLARFGHPQTTALPPLVEEDLVSRSGLFAPSMRWLTILLALGYVTHMTTFFFMTKWIPTIFSRAGYSDAEAAGVIVWVNVGGVAGALLFSLLAKSLPLFRLSIFALLMTSALMIVLGLSVGDLFVLSKIAAALGFFANASVIGMMGIVAMSFPVQLRAGGTGLVTGIGRGGAVFGPVMAGTLVAAAFTPSAVFATMAMGSLLAAIVLFVLSWVRQATPRDQSASAVANPASNT